MSMETLRGVRYAEVARRCWGLGVSGQALIKFNTWLFEIETLVLVRLAAAFMPVNRISTGVSSFLRRAVAEVASFRYSCLADERMLLTKV